MNNDVEEMVKRLSFENLIWIGFIITSALDIYGDEIIKKGLVTNDKNARKKANKLFLGISFFSILVYIYFLMRNYNDYQKKKTDSYQIRFIGSILILSGALCLTYFQMKNMDPTESPSNV